MTLKKNLDTALYYASENGYYASENGYYASENGYFDIAQYLVEGSDLINLGSCNLNTALQGAANGNKTT